MDELADWAARLMDVLKVERAYVGGNSMGCQVALSLARRHPERVGGLILLGPTTGHSQVPFWRYALGLLLDGIGESPVYNLKLLGMYSQMGLRRYLATVRHMMADDPLAHAGEVRAPCLVTRGGNDRIVPEDAAKELAAALPRGEYQALDHTAHAAEYNTPDLFVIGDAGVHRASGGTADLAATQSVPALSGQGQPPTVDTRQRRASPPPLRNAITTSPPSGVRAGGGLPGIRRRCPGSQ